MNGNLKWVALAIAGLALASGLAAAIPRLIVHGPSQERLVQPARPSTATSPPRFVSNGGHNAPSDGLDEATSSGPPIAVALQRIAAPITLPDTGIVGDPVKVITPSMTGETSTTGLMVLYSSGAKFIYHPFETAAEERTWALPDPVTAAKRVAPYTDSRAIPFAILNRNGQVFEVVEAGTQLTPRGERAAPSSLTWRAPHGTYVLKAPGLTSAQLLAAVQGASTK